MLHKVCSLTSRARISCGVWPRLSNQFTSLWNGVHSLAAAFRTTAGQSSKCQENCHPLQPDCKTCLVVVFSILRRLQGMVWRKVQGRHFWFSPKTGAGYVKEILDRSCYRGGQAAHAIVFVAFAAMPMFQTRLDILSDSHACFASARASTQFRSKNKSVLRP